MSSKSPNPITGRTFGSRGTTMAIACGTAVAALFGLMYIKGRNVKSNEGQSSMYAKQGQGLGRGDKAMTSSDVSAAVTSGGSPKQNPEKEEASKVK